jgi:hypothetical protein
MVERANMDDEQDPQISRADDEQALEEIRQLFARYRRIARHGMVTERDEPAGERETVTVAGT